MSLTFGQIPCLSITFIQHKRFAGTQQARVLLLSKPTYICQGDISPCPGFNVEQGFRGLMHAFEQEYQQMAVFTGVCVVILVVKVIACGWVT